MTDTLIDEGGPAARLHRGRVPRRAVLEAIRAHREVSMMVRGGASGLCLAPRVDGPAEWLVRWYLPGGAAIHAFDPANADRRGRMWVRHGGVRVDENAALALPTDAVVSIVKRYFRHTLHVEDSAGYAWSLDSVGGPDRSPHRLVRLRALLRA